MQWLGRQGAMRHSPINLENGPLKFVYNDKKWPIENFKIIEKSWKWPIWLKPLPNHCSCTPHWHHMPLKRGHFKIKDLQILQYFHFVASGADFLKFSPYISNILQVLSDQRMKCTATSYRTVHFFIGKSDRSYRFQELCSGGICVSQTRLVLWYICHFCINFTVCDYW